MPAALILRTLLLASAWIAIPAAWAAEAPAWLRAQVGAALPAHDEETQAVLLYSETQLTVLAPGKMKRLERRAYRILRDSGESYGSVGIPFTPQSRILSLRGWSLPTQGKPFEVAQRDIAELAYTDVEGGELITDLRRKFMRIPAPLPGNIIGYEFEQELLPYEMSDEWFIQDSVPVREAHYVLRMPAGWSYQAFWLNHGEMPPIEEAPNQFRWKVMDVKPVRLERRMPPWRGIAGRLVLSLQPPGGEGGGFRSWRELGSWYGQLLTGRRESSPEIRQKVAQLAPAMGDVLSKMKALAAFVQTDIRYVAVELGIGGQQPHPAQEVFANGYGDCKDKVVLLSAMLKDIGIESHLVLVNVERGALDESSPPNLGFNHAIIAIRLPEGVDQSQLSTVIPHKTLGPLLFFDPTHPLIPLGQLPGELQANVGLVVSSSGSELLKLPLSPAALNGLRRKARLTLGEDGTLQGDVEEVWSGGAGAEQRYALRSAPRDADQIKPVESMLTESLSTFQILKATVSNVRALDRPLIWNYTIEVPNYPRKAGDLRIVRPRVFGSVSSGFLETKESRQNPIEFEAPVIHSDEFDITVPAGFAPESLPSPVEQNLGFMSYRSATTFKGNVLRYTRTLEIRDPSAPAARAEAIKQLFRTIESDERKSVVLVRSP